MAPLQLWFPRGGAALPAVLIRSSSPEAVQRTLIGRSRCSTGVANACAISD